MPNRRDVFRSLSLALGSAMGLAWRAGGPVPARPAVQDGAGWRVPAADEALPARRRQAAVVPDPRRAARRLGEVPARAGRLGLADPPGERKDAKVVAFTAECPHKGCAIGLGAGGRFSCPCHKAEFDLDGQARNDVSPRGMDPLEVKLSGGDDPEVLVKFERFRPMLKERKPLVLSHSSSWLGQRTGAPDVIRHALDAPIPGGARWRYVLGSALTACFLIEAVHRASADARLQPVVGLGVGERLLHPVSDGRRLVPPRAAPVRLVRDGRAAGLPPAPDRDRRGLPGAPRGELVGRDRPDAPDARPRADREHAPVGPARLLGGRRRDGDRGGRADGRAGDPAAGRRRAGLRQPDAHEDVRPPHRASCRPCSSSVSWPTRPWSVATG